MAVTSSSNLKADTAATCHALKEYDSPGETIIHEPVKITSATKDQQLSSSTKLLPLHEKISRKAKKGSAFTNISHNLLSIPVLCDDDCECTFTKEDMQCIKEGEVVLKGKREHLTGLWDVNIQTNKKVHFPSDVITK